MPPHAKHQKDAVRANPILWKRILSDASAEGVSDEKALELEKGVSSQLQQHLAGVDPRHLGAHQVFVLISAAELNQTISGLDPSSTHSQRALVSLNNVLHLSPHTTAAALAQHGLIEGELGCETELPDDVNNPA